MKHRYDRISNIYSNVQEVFSNESIEADPEFLKTQIACLYFPGPSFHCIVNIPTLTFDYISESVKEVLGFDAKDIDPEKLYDQVHKNDLQKVLEFEEISIRFLASLPNDEKFLYKVNYHMTMQNIDFQYRTILYQKILLSLDNNNNLSKVVISFSDISDLGKNDDLGISFIDIRGKKSYFNIKKIEDIEKTQFDTIYFSKREMEILKLIAEGYNSEMISNNLNISRATVRTHRTNILQKSKMSKMTKVVTHCIREGII